MKNMNIVLSALTLSCALSLNVFAQAQKPAMAAPKKAWSRPYGMAGCGLGSVVMGKSGGQVLAYTTNGTSGNQTFGISSGTLNCEDDPNLSMASRMDQFVSGNRVQLAGDIARGSGEAIQNLALLTGCEASQLAPELKANFRQIFPTAEVPSNEVTDSIITVIKSSDGLAQSCGQVS